MSSNIFYRLALWCLLALVPGAVLAQQAVPGTTQSAPAAAANKLQLVIEGKVIKVHDGDTITVLDQDNKKFSIRLQGIDAPELKQEAGAVSQQNLSRMVLGKQVTIVWDKVDKYRRTVGTIMLDGRDINIEQVKAGMAWHFKKYQDEQSPADRVTYAAAEQAARTGGLGLWKVASPTAPGDWRQDVKTKRWGPPPPPGTIIGNSNSKKYHRPDCAGYRDMAERNRVFFKTVVDAEAAGYKRAGNCPAEIQIVRAATAPVPVTPQPTTVTPSPPSIIVPVAPQVPRPGLSAPNTTVPGLIIGNKNSKIYHLPGCSGYTRVSEKNQVRFKDTGEAEAAGYQLAKNCSTDSAIETTEQTPVTRQTESAPPVAAAASTGTEGKVVGNKNSQIYHLPACSGYKTVSEKNRVYFDTEAEAEKAGYRKAKNCK